MIPKQVISFRLPVNTKFLFHQHLIMGFGFEFGYVGQFQKLSHNHGIDLLAIVQAAMTDVIKGDDSSSQVSLDAQGRSLRKKVKVRMYHPFNCPPYMSHPYSEFRHLSKETRDFALSLATSTGIKSELREEPVEDSEERLSEARKQFLDKFSSLSSVYQKSLQQPSSTSKGSDQPNGPCKEKSCLDMIQAVAAARNVFKIENAEIQSQFEELSLLQEDNARHLEDLKEKRTHTDSIGDSLEAVLKTHTAELDKLVATNEELIAERESFNSKFSHLEYKLHTLLRQHQDASAELYRVLWGDNDSNSKGKILSPNLHTFQQTSHSNLSGHIKIKPVSDKEISLSSSPSITLYSALAREDIVDTSEKLPNLPTVSHSSANLLSHSISSYSGKILTQSAFRHSFSTDTFYRYSDASLRRKDHDIMRKHSLSRRRSSTFNLDRRLKTKGIVYMIRKIPPLKLIN